MAFIKLTYEKLTYEFFIIQFNLNGPRRNESAQVPRTYYDSALLSDILEKWDSLVCVKSSIADWQQKVTVACNLWCRPKASELHSVVYNR